MALVAGDRVLTSRPSDSVLGGPLAFPRLSWVFGTVTEYIEGGSVNVLWDNGVVSSSVLQQSFDRVNSEEVPEQAPDVVRPVGAVSPEYDGVVIGVYPRYGLNIDTGEPFFRGTFFLVQLIHSGAFIEGLASDFVAVEGR